MFRVNGLPIGQEPQSLGIVFSLDHAKAILYAIVPGRICRILYGDDVKLLVFSEDCGSEMCSQLIDEEIDLVTAVLPSQFS